MAGGVGDLFIIEKDFDKDQFEIVEKSRAVWFTFGKSLELMKIDLFNLKRKNCNDPEIVKQIENISIDIFNLDKDIRRNNSYLHCLKLYLQIAENLIWVHVCMNNVSL
jgi:hypothetical protein